MFNAPSAVYASHAAGLYSDVRWTSDPTRPADTRTHAADDSSIKARPACRSKSKGSCRNAVRDMSLAEIERFEIFHGNEKLPLADFFSVSGSAGDGRIEFEGNLAGVHWIGAGMAERRDSRRRATPAATSAAK